MMATPATHPAGIAVKRRMMLAHAEAALPKELNEQGDLSEHPLGSSLLSALHAERLGGAS